MVILRYCYIGSFIFLKAHFCWFSFRQVRDDSRIWRSLRLIKDSYSFSKIVWPALSSLLKGWSKQIKCCSSTLQRCEYATGYSHGNGKFLSLLSEYKNLIQFFHMKEKRCSHFINVWAEIQNNIILRYMVIILTVGFILLSQIYICRAAEVHLAIHKSFTLVTAE